MSDAKSHPAEARDEDCEAHLRRSYCDSTEDDEARRRFVKRMRDSDVEALRQRGLR